LPAAPPASCEGQQAAVSRSAEQIGAAERDADLQRAALHLFVRTLEKILRAHGPG
jgi:hypothetical protein